MQDRRTSQFATHAMNFHKRPYADLKTPALDADLSLTYIVENGTSIYLGQWSGGEPVGPTGLTGVPDIPSGRTPEEVKDQIRANGLLASLPRDAHDVLVAARRTTIALRRRVAELRGLGYSTEAVRDAMSQMLDVAARTLNGASADLVRARDRVAADYTAALDTFPASNEPEAVGAIYDSAIVAKLLPLAPADHAMFRDGLVPQRLQDVRAVLALTRVPRALIDLSDDEMAQLLDANARRVSPWTLIAIDYLRERIEEARNALAAAVVNFAAVAMLPLDQAFAKVEGADWLYSRSRMLGYTREDLAAIDRRGAEYEAARKLRTIRLI